MKRLAPLLAVVLLLPGACAGDDPGRRPGAVAPPPSTSTSTSTSTTAPPTTTSTSPPATEPPTTAPTTRPAPAPAAAPAAPAGTLAWSKCGALQCSTLRVPLHYDHPAGPTIDLALARRPAKSPDRRIGSLVFNPGGPGSSGIDSLPGELRVLTPALQARFDIVTFDPRGIGRSAPVRCHAGAAGPSPDNGPSPDPAPTTEEGRRALLEGFRAYAAACAQHSGDLLGQVGTDSTAEDLERLRVALGEERLTFIGHSAGTLLGAIYAERYPQRVRAFVLDGPIDPSISLDQMTLAQAAGFEHSLSEFFGWCAATAGCAWRPATEPRRAYVSLLDRVRQQPLAAPGHQAVGVGDLITGTMSRLTSRSRWASLGDALGAAERGDGTPLAKLASAYENHGATNAADAHQAIICLDHPAPRDPAAYPSLVEAATARAPVFGPVFLWAALSCGVWSVPATLPARAVRAAGAPPILVVGTTGDPATPQAWAEALAAQLEHGVLVLRQGAEHVAYYYSACVRGIVDAYLIDGRPPASGTVCAR